MSSTASTYRYNQGSALPCKIMALACNNDGYMYGIGIDGNLYELDVDTGEAEEIGELGVTPDNYTQSAYFDPKTGILYWAAMLDDGTSGLYEVDTETVVKARYEALEKESDERYEACDDDDECRDTHLVRNDLAQSRYYDV